MTPRPHSSRVLTPWLLAGPGALFFAGMILLPLALTVILSFRAYDHATGIKDTYTLAHYIAVVTDEYYLEIFWRTLRIAALRVRSSRRARLHSSSERRPCSA